MKLRFFLSAVLLYPILVQADIYKAVDADGHVTYSSTPIKGGKKLNLDPLPTTAPRNKTSSPMNFPKVDEKIQKERDEKRRSILQDELEAEQKLLEEAKYNLSEASPEVFISPGGKISRNVAKYEEKIKELNEQVELHEKNIGALKTELSKQK